MARRKQLWMAGGQPRLSCGVRPAGHWGTPLACTNAPQIAKPNENLLSPLLHLVERPDLRDPALDLAVRRPGRPGRVRQPLLPDQGWQDRSDAADGAPMGDLQRRGRSLLGATVLARLAASHRRRPADRREVPAAALAEAAPPEPHRHAGRTPADRLDLGARPAAEGDRRLQGVESWAL